MTCHYTDLGSASDWSCRVRDLFQPIRSTTQNWVMLLSGRAPWGLLQPIRSDTHMWEVTRHQCEISVLVSRTSFRGETSVGVFRNIGGFSQAREIIL